MKKAMFLITGLLATAAFAGMNNVVVTFSTQGPDKYADGSTVLDGECYALVWTPDGAEFAGINADGSAVAPSKVAIAAPIAKGGKCPQVLFQIDEEYRKANFPGGTWCVVLLDTRRYKVDAQGFITSEFDSVGDKKSVSGYGKVATLDGSAFAAANAETGSADAKAAIAAGSVKITGIKPDGDNVIITAVAPAGARVGLSAGLTPDSIAPISGEKYGSEDMVFITPKAGDKGFFGLEAK